MYFDYLSLFIDTSTKQFIGYGAVLIAFFSAVLTILSKFDSLESFLGINNRNRKYLCIIILFLTFSFGGGAYSFSRLYFYGRAIEITSRSDYSENVTTQNYAFFHNFLIDNITIPKLERELGIFSVIITGPLKLRILLFFIIGLCFSIPLIYLHKKNGYEPDPEEQPDAHNNEENDNEILKVNIIDSLVDTDIKGLKFLYQILTSSRASGTRDYHSLNNTYIIINSILIASISNIIINQNSDDKFSILIILLSILGIFLSLQMGLAQDRIRSANFYFEKILRIIEQQKKWKDGKYPSIYLVLSKFRDEKKKLESLPDYAESEMTPGLGISWGNIPLGFRMRLFPLVFHIIYTGFIIYQSINIIQNNIVTWVLVIIFLIYYIFLFIKIPFFRTRDA